MNIELIGIKDFPLIKEGDNLPEIIYESLLNNDISLSDSDILVLAETVVSKAEGNYVKVDDVTPSKKAMEMSRKSGKDAKQCQIILDNSRDILRCQNGLIITESKHGFVCANSGIDNSNCEEGFVTPLPVDPDKSAGEIKKFLDEKFNADSKIIISDTQGRAWRVGAIGVAVGISGLHPTTDFRGSYDLYGQELMSTIEATADELASAASLLMGQSDSGICLVLIRGYDSSLTSCGLDDSNIGEILREKDHDAFR
ncbi:MAG: coenzyme F420-0:L-glutamate ligase [Methanobrevibacter sp.]|nr:coenzyme F420-0:L-glutamate ligase [Methanobrevibacter sp.]MBQ6220957.1 coenzyme F420-0:L-glutamate ligase [Methanosphaera sp.]